MDVGNDRHVPLAWYSLHVSLPPGEHTCPEGPRAQQTATSLLTELTANQRLVAAAGEDEFPQVWKGGHRLTRKDLHKVCASAKDTAIYLERDFYFNVFKIRCPSVMSPNLIILWLLKCLQPKAKLPDPPGQVGSLTGTLTSQGLVGASWEENRGTA